MCVSRVEGRVGAKLGASPLLAHQEKRYSWFSKASSSWSSCCSSAYEAMRRGRLHESEPEQSVRPHPPRLASPAPPLAFTAATPHVYVYGTLLHLRICPPVRLHKVCPRARRALRHAAAPQCPPAAAARRCSAPPPRPPTARKRSPGPAPPSRRRPPTCCAPRASCRAQ